jgi:glycosyltransferase involved in cell wall biosynthesis
MDSGSMNENKKNRKILFLTQDLKIGGGIQRVVSVLGKELRKRGYKTDFCVFEDPDNIHEIGDSQYTVLDSGDRAGNIIGRLLMLFLRAKEIAKISNQENISYLIAHSSKPSFAAILSKIFFNPAKVIACVHNNPKQKMGSKTRFLVRLLYSFAETVVGVSKGVTHYLKKDFGLKNTTTIYNPVDIEKARHQAKKQIPDQHKQIFSDQGEVFINVGSLTPQKGQWHLVRAFTKVIDKYPKAKLVILGEGKLRGKLEGLINKCGLEKNVFLLGNKENVFPYLNAANCFVLSSLYEGMPLVILEALATGLPVISTDCDFGPREEIAPNLSHNQQITYPHKAKHGLLTKQASASAIFECLNTFNLKPPEEMLSKAMIDFASGRFEASLSDSVMDKFKNDAIANQWVDLL